jgi:hypothetical protein
MKIHHHHRHIQDQNHCNHTIKHCTHCTVPIIIRWMFLGAAETRPAPSRKHTTVPDTKRMGCYNTSGHHRSNISISAAWCWLPQLDNSTQQRRDNNFRRQTTYMTSYRSELGDIIAGLAAIGMLHLSGLVCPGHIKFVCNNSAAIITAKKTVTQSIFYRLESEYDLIPTMKLMQWNWCRDCDITYEWVKGHTDRGNEEPNKEERLNIDTDALYDVIRNEATGPIAS